MFYYNLNEQDLKRQNNDIKAIKNKNITLNTHFKTALISGMITCFCFLVILFLVKNNYPSQLINMGYIIIGIIFLAIPFFYFIESYKISYELSPRQLIVKRVFKTTHIPKEKLKKIYLFDGISSSRTILCINYIDQKEKDKKLFLSTAYIRYEELEQFLDSFIV